MKLFRSLLWALLVTLVWAEPAGLTATQCYAFVQELAGDPQITDLRGNLSLRNDSGKAWTQAQVLVHVMDGYGAPIFNFKGPTFPTWGVREQKDIPIFQPGYRGGVRVFQLGAEVNARAEGQDVHFEIPPTDAATGAAPKLNY